ncbi:MAG: TonB-dependent receptor [Saprospiraceae bacterium]|nr:TonB-dependent receptor [Saprospiraceae bacterium]
MKKCIFLSTLLMVVFFHDHLSGQAWSGRNQAPSVTGKITGEIVDTITGQPVEFATIALRIHNMSNDIDGVISNDKGQFKLPEVKLGSYDMIISFIGYESRILRKIELTPEKPDFDAGIVFLVNDEIVLGQVEVTAQAAVIENKVDRIVYNADKDATIVGGDAADVLRKVPMLSVDLEGNVSLRGSSNIKILLNGKPSGMFSNNVADALKMFPADQIKSVEVITTPGAKYDGEGTGGIVNIITKKKNVQGYSGSVTSAIGTRQNRLSLNLNAAQGRFGMNAAGNAFYSWPQNADNTFYREDRIGGQLRTLNQNGITESSRIGFWGQAGAFYDFNAYNSINSSFNLRGHTFDQSSVLDAAFRDPFSEIFQDYNRINENDNLRSGYDWNTDYRKTYKTPEREFSVAFQISGENSEDNIFLDQRSEDLDLVLRELSANTGRSLESTLQVDYVHPFSKNYKLEVGSKGVLRKIDSDYDYRGYDNDVAQYVVDNQRSDNFNYHQDVYAAYVSNTLAIRKDYSLVAGVRFEQTAIKGSFLNNDDVFSNKYSNFIPSIILSKKIGFNTVKVSYVKRIQRPSLFYINPYVNLSDRRNITYGNPTLAPEISNQYDVGYTSFKRGTVLSTSLYYRRTTDVIQSLLNVSEEGISETSYSNIGLAHVYGFNLFTSFTIKDFWTLRSNLDLNSFYTKSESLNLENRAFQYKAFLNSSFNFKHGIKADIFGFLNSPRFTLQGRTPSFSMMSLGINKEIFNKRGKIGITMIDPFNETKKFVSELEGVTFYQKTDFRLPFRSFGINFSYTFGKLDFKAKQRSSKIKNNDLKSGEQGQGASTNTQG